MTLACLVGAQIVPVSEVISREGRVLPGTGTRVADQVAQGENGALHVVFRTFKGNERKTAVYYSQREAGGSAWSEPIQISEDSEDCQPPVIAGCADGSLLTAWIDAAEEGRFAAVVRRSDDGGKTWASVLRHPSGVTRVQPKLLASGKTAYLCFSSAPKSGVGERVYFLRGQEAGRTWSEKDLNFKEPRSYSSQPDLLIRGDSVWATWCDQDVRGVRSVVLTSSGDRGETFPREPVMVSDAGPEAPSDAKFDDSQSGVVVLWRSVHPGSRSLIFQDRCEENRKCDTDRILLKSNVIPVTYRIVKHSNNRILLWLGEKGGLSGKQKQIYWINVTDHSINSSQEVVVWPGAEHADVSEFDVRVLGETLYLAAVARFRAGDWRLLLLSRKADGQDQKWVIGGEERKERSSLALIALSDDIGWLFQERRPRRLPMESRLSDSLVFGRLSNHQ